MGNCLHRSAVSSSRDETNAWISPRIAVGKNQPLKRGPMRWCSAQPIHLSHLQKKRDEFWDTAPAFDGRKEIWDALRSAAEASERGDHELAQAIIDSANIILPTGTLAECYDELGSRYQLPVFVLCRPTNLDEGEEQEEEAGVASQLDVVQRAAATPEAGDHEPLATMTTSTNRLTDAVADIILDNAGSTSPTTLEAILDPEQTHPTSSMGSLSRFCRCHFHHARKRQHPRRVKQKHKRLGCACGNGDEADEEEDESELVELRIRLSMGDEHTLTVSSQQTIREAKKALSSLIGNWLPERQRWFCSGLALRDDSRISQCHIPTGFVVQVIIHSPLDPESNWRRPTHTPQ